MEEHQNTTQTEQPEVQEEVRYCLYARKSTEQDEKQALSIDSQVKEMTQLAERDGLKITEVKRESHSAKAQGQRPVFNELLKDVQEGKFNGVLTWAPDRLSRNAGDLGAIVDLMDKNILREIRTFGQNFTNSPNEKFLLMILGSQAKLENDNKGINVKRGLRAKCEQGLWPSEPPTGYLKDQNRDRKGHLIVDPERAPVIKQMFEKVAYDGWSGRRLHYWLKHDVNFKTRFDQHLTLSNIYMILSKHFYYGKFEYPGDSGNWYTGQYTPIISRELFEKVQEQINKNRKDLPGYRFKEFAFTRLMKCGLCGSGISAEEKFKHQKNGMVNRYVYYSCTKSRDRYCKSGYLNEDDLIKQFEKMIDEMDLSKLGIKKKIKEEIERYNKFRSGVLGIETEKTPAVQELDIRNYAKYILREGKIVEKRELLMNLKSRIYIKKKEIYLE